MSGAYLRIRTKSEDRDRVIESLQGLGSGVSYVVKESCLPWNITVGISGSAEEIDSIYGQAQKIPGVSFARVVDAENVGIGGMRVYQHPGNGKPCGHCESIHPHTVEVDKRSGEAKCRMRESDLVPSNPITNLRGILESVIKFYKNF